MRIMSEQAEQSVKNEEVIFETVQELSLPSRVQFRGLKCVEENLKAIYIR